MPDNQWPRFMVFQQEAEGKPMLHNGSVHAPDIEMSLLNARDVFARRPEAAIMWVAPADAIYTKTPEELANPHWGEDAPQMYSGSGTYYVFAKLSQQAQCSYLGEVEADSLVAAMQSAIEAFGEQDPLWWWVLPANSVLGSTPDDADPMFAPARAKTFKRQSEYPVVTLMRALHSKGRLDE
jgi:ring-1,2-phenylacetyl-CoA epoxidase subunit PaaB